MAEISDVATHSIPRNRRLVVRDHTFAYQQNTNPAPPIDTVCRLPSDGLPNQHRLPVLKTLRNIMILNRFACGSPPYIWYRKLFSGKPLRSTLSIIVFGKQPLRLRFPILLQLQVLGI